MQIEKIDFIFEKMKCTFFKQNIVTYRSNLLPLQLKIDKKWEKEIEKQERVKL